MSFKKWVMIATVALALLGWTRKASFAQDAFYKGKTVRIVVGFSAGGGFDTYSRILARHLGKHIPGNPTVVVENMTGAASMIAANHIYNVAKPDGLTIGNWNGGLILNQLFQRPGVNFDASKFEWIGAPIAITSICTFSKQSGISSVDKWVASPKPVKVGATGLGSDLYDFPKILQAALNLPTQFVSGYKGFAEIKLAVESGEVDGVCPSWEITKSTWKKSVESGDIAIVLQALPKAHPDLPAVPLAISRAKTDQSRQLIETGIHDVSTINRPYSLPPGTPKDRVLLLRKAFIDTLNDVELRAEANKSQLDFDPKTGETIEKTVSRVLSLESTTANKLKDILKQ